jgi:hypothetical protein
MLVANSEEADSAASSVSAQAMVRHELLSALERAASEEAYKALAQLSKARKGYSSSAPSNKAVEKETKLAKDKIKEEARRIKSLCEKLGLALGKSSPSSSSSSSRPTKETPASMRDTTLSALQEALAGAAAALDEPTSEGFGVEVAACLNRCVEVGAGAEAAAAYGKGMQRALEKAMTAATEPLLARAATKRQLGKMLQRSHDSEGPKLEVEVDDSDDPKPHFTAFAKVLSAASVVLGDLHATAQRLLESAGDPALSAALAALLMLVATAASLKAKRVSDLFSAESGLERSHAVAADWLSQLEERARGGSTGDDGGGPAAVKSPDLLELDALLEDLCDLLSLTHRFFGFLQQGLSLSFAQVSTLPLFVDSFTLATLYVDLEAAYFLRWASQFSSRLLCLVPFLTSAVLRFSRLVRCTARLPPRLCLKFKQTCTSQVLVRTSSSSFETR